MVKIQWRQMERVVQREQSDVQQSVPAGFKQRISRLHGTHFIQLSHQDTANTLQVLRDGGCHGNAENNTDVPYQQA